MPSNAPSAAEVEMLAATILHDVLRSDTADAPDAVTLSAKALLAILDRHLLSALQSATARAVQGEREFKTLKLAVCLEEDRATHDRIRDRYVELLDDPARVDGEYGRYEVLKEFGVISSSPPPGASK